MRGDIRSWSAVVGGLLVLRSGMGVRQCGGDDTPPAAWTIDEQGECFLWMPRQRRANDSRCVSVRPPGFKDVLVSYG
jgi:hypothetical protein